MAQEGFGLMSNCPHIVEGLEDGPKDVPITPLQTLHMTLYGIYDTTEAASSTEG